jgi:lipopolysaccharide transport system ATP-binding protein
MYVRLAFAVAAFLDPEILIVDEVLAVGDSAFQRKSLGRLNAAASEQGRTVLFVSHNLQAIRNFCKRVLILEKGRLIFDGSTQEGIERYLKAISTKVDLRGVKMKDRLNRSSGVVRFTSSECFDQTGQPSWQIKPGQNLTLRFGFEALESVSNIQFDLRLSSALSREVVTTVRKCRNKPIAAGTVGTIEVKLPALQLRPGELSLYVWIGSSDKQFPYDTIDDNVDLPYIQILAEGSSPQSSDGIVSIEHSIEFFY